MYICPAVRTPAVPVSSNFPSTIHAPEVPNIVVEPLDPTSEIVRDPDGVADPARPVIVKIVSEPVRSRDVENVMVMVFDAVGSGLD